MQASVLSVLNERSHTGGMVMSPGIFVVVTWGSYGYLFYAMAQTGEISRLPEIEPNPGMHIRRYEMRGTEIRMAFLMGYITESNLMVLLKNIKIAEEEGLAVFIPEEAAQSEIIAELGEGSFITY